MRRISLWSLSTLSALVLLFSYSTSTGQAASHVEAPVAAGGTPTDGSVSATTATTSSSSARTTTYTGDSVSTQWGPVQVRITVSEGRITAAEAVAYPTGNPRDEEINSQAIPTYDAEAVSAQSAQIDAISGATVTWGGYTQSLQSAIDQAGLP